MVCFVGIPSHFLFLQVSGILLTMKGNKQFKTIKEPVSSDCG